MKAPTLPAAIESVLAQTRQDFQLLVVDSGRWRGQPGPASKQMAKVHRSYSGHPLVEWTFTGEGPGLRERTCPVGWATNQAIRQGLVRGMYMCTFYDDDRYLPGFVERMAGYLDTHPQAGAVWCTELLATLAADGTETLVATRPATETRYGASFDCRVDGAQVMWRTSLLDVIGDPWLPEDPGSCYHSDGVFLDKLGSVCGAVPPVAEPLVVHRFTRLSAYTPLAAIANEGLQHV
jgi:hypothetical protein